MIDKKYVLSTQIMLRRASWVLQFSVYFKFILFAVLTFAIVFSVSINGIVTDSYAQNQQNKGKVFVMYAASLGKIFEQALGPSFEKKTGYAYTGEGRGSIQIANMIIDGQRKPDVIS